MTGRSVPPHTDEIAQALAYAFLTTDWDRASLLAAGRVVLGRNPRWLGPVAAHVVALYRIAPVDRPRELASTIEMWPKFSDGVRRSAARSRPIRIKQLTVEPTRMLGSRWAVPSVDHLDGLARTLGLLPEHLSWMADQRGMQRRTPAGPYHLYRYHWIERSGRLPRLIEAPTPLLRQTLRRVLEEILINIPPHDAAHGFVRGRSAITHARRHVGRDCVVSFDLQQFFASVPARRVRGAFRMMGYPEPVAARLTGLSTTRTPTWVLAAMPPGGDTTHRYWLGAQLRAPHLAQGAPTSPALSNLICYGLDTRLTGYADRLGATYSRYADDLTFSGGASFRDRVPALVAAVQRMVGAEGFALNPAKTRVEFRGGRQRVTGIVVNDRLGIPRADYDRLRAILHKARRDGVETANRSGHPYFREHLSGRISWVESVNAPRGRRLREQFDSLAWPG